MAKNRIEFLCRECGSNHVKWLGKCPDCGAWDSLDKFAVEAESAKSASAPIWGVAPDGAEAEDLARSGIGRAVALGSVPEASVPRLPTGISELDRVLGGGIVPGSVMLLGGDPGIGKSTLIMQAAASIAARGGVALYASSEESPQQVRLRAERLQAVISAGGSKALGERMLVMGETNVARIIEQARRSRASLVLVDSIQLVHRADVSAAPGSIAQLRRCCLDLVGLAKSTGCGVILVGHVTKEGTLAGPKLLEHLVDVVLGFEGDRHSATRVVRGVKNRFGSTQEIGLFEMRGDGLAELESVRVPLSGGPTAPGCSFVATMAGTRCLLGEINALVATGFLGSAKRRVSGLDSGRLAMLIAVLEKHGFTLLFWQPADISIVNHTYYILNNLQYLVPLHKKNKTQLVLNYPIAESGGGGANFIAPELRTWKRKRLLRVSLQRSHAICEFRFEPSWPASTIAVLPISPRLVNRMSPDFRWPFLS